LANGLDSALQRLWRHGHPLSETEANLKTSLFRGIAGGDTPRC
jgi:hypothetical protein